MSRLRTWLPQRRLTVCRSSFVILCTSLLLSACRIIPVQMVRVTQTEFYTQTFQSLKVEESGVVVQDRPVNFDQNKRIDDTFDRLLGANNWQSFKDMFGLATVRDELLNGKIVSKGLLTFTIYISPTDHSQFFIEGSGTYFIIRVSTNEVLLSGEFRLPLQKHSIKRLEEGLVPINVYLYTSNIPNNTTYFHEAHLIYGIYVEHLRNSSKTYILKRTNFEKRTDVLHPVYLLDEFDDKTRLLSAQIGTLSFEKDDDRSKAIDLRGLRMVRRYD